MFLDKNNKNLENFTNFNFITKFLHNNKYILLEKMLKENFAKSHFTVLDIGSGLSEFYRKFNHKFNFNYFGIEKNLNFFNTCKNKLSINKNYDVVLSDIENVVDNLEGKDLILCLDILEHIDFKLRKKLIFKISQIKFKKLFINVPNEFGPAIFIKNFGSRLINYKRDFEYTFLETLYATFYMSHKLPPHENKHKNFYWKDLQNLLNIYFHVEVKTNINNLLPKHFSPTISFICTKNVSSD